MFTHCIHCCGALGTNDVIEPFPVGRKLAFDSERGRLWVICPHCARWNLTPLEERWEAVEECERLFRRKRLRAQTANIGYAAAADGTGLVRIGRPLRPEFAAWRYGQEFSRRRTRALVALGAAGFLVGGIALGSVYVGAGMFLPHLGAMAYNFYGLLAGAPGDVELPRGPGRAWTVSGDGTMILPDAESGWRLSIRHHFGRAEYRGAEAGRLLASVLARINRSGGSDALVRSAVAEVEQRPAEELLRSVALRSESLWAVDGPRLQEFERDHWGDRDRPINRAGLSRLSASSRLALEMTLHESSEQRAIAGELAELEIAWREAEEIAGIADNLLLPPGVEEFIADHRRKGGASPASNKEIV